MILVHQEIQYEMAILALVILSLPSCLSFYLNGTGGTFPEDVYHVSLPSACFEPISQLTVGGLLLQIRLCQ